MGDQQPPDEGFADGIVGITSYDVPGRQKKEFLPWHRPRKQLVRNWQWREQIEKLLDEGRHEGDTLLYLGLPGVDLLDLRYFHSQICEPRKRRLRFLGFNSGTNPASDDQTELNISLAEVQSLALIDPQSDVIVDDFRRMANENSIAWQRTLAVGPYHVINLDLCDGFGVQAPGVLEDTHYNAVNQLFSLQARSIHSWLLLLTTRVGKEDIHEEVLQRLLDKYVANLTTCPPFQAASEQYFEISDETSLREAEGTSRGLLDIFLVGLCKWLMGLAIIHQPRTKIEIRNVMGYRVATNAEHEDLISLAIRFSPIFTPVEDPIKLASQPGWVSNECKLAVRAVKRVGKLVDADAILAKDSVIREDMVRETSLLLELARYDISAYHQWLKELP